MDKNKSNFENIFDNLYSRAEREGTAQFDNEQDRELSKSETMGLYRQYYELIDRRSTAYEKVSLTSHIGDSREQKKYIKQQKREGKKEIKELNKQLENITKMIEDKTSVMFDLVGVGGFEEAKKMIQIAYREDLKEKREQSFCPKVRVNETEARNNADKVKEIKFEEEQR